jgi:hypothetical protein
MCDIICVYRRMVFMSLLCLVWYLLSAPTVGTFFTEDHTGELDVQFVEAFTLVEKFVKLCMAMAVIYFTNDTWVAPTVVIGGLIILLITQLYLRPCQHIEWVNNLRAGLYGLALWSGICSVVAKANADPTNKIPLVLFGIGWGAIIFLTFVSIVYGNTRSLFSCKIPFIDYRHFVRDCIAKMNVENVRAAYEAARNKDRAANQSMRKLDDIFVEMSPHDTHHSPAAIEHVAAYGHEEKKQPTGRGTNTRTGNGSSAPSPHSEISTTRPASGSNSGASHSISHQVRDNTSPSSVPSPASDSHHTPLAIDSSETNNISPPAPVSSRGRLLSPSAHQLTSQSSPTNVLLSPPAVRKHTRGASASPTSGPIQPPSPSLNPFDDDFDDNGSTATTPSPRPASNSQPAAASSMLSPLVDHDDDDSLASPASSGSGAASPYASYAITPSHASSDSSHPPSDAPPIPSARPKRKAPPTPLTHLGNERNQSNAGDAAGGSHGVAPPIPANRPTRAAPVVPVPASPRTPTPSVAPPSPSATASPSSSSSSKRPLLSASISSDSLAVPAAIAPIHYTSPTVASTVNVTDVAGLPPSLARMIVASPSQEEVKPHPSPLAAPSSSTLPPTASQPSSIVPSATIAVVEPEVAIASRTFDSDELSRDDDGSEAPMSFSHLT